MPVAGPRCWSAMRTAISRPSGCSGKFRALTRPRFSGPEICHDASRLAAFPGLTSFPAGGYDGNQDASTWSADVTRRSNALDLEPGVFAFEDPKRIAASLRH